MSESVSESSSKFYPADETLGIGYYNYKAGRVHGTTQLGTVTGYGRTWFVKSLAEGYREVRECQLSLIKEYEILMRLRRSQIPEVINLCEIEGVGLSIVMEYVEGEHLDKYLKHASRRQRKIVLQSLAEAVAFIHSRGIAHLDLKPENILVRGTYRNPEVCLIDFNLSDSQVFSYNKKPGGNERYAALEQLQPDYQGDVRADVWSLGKLLQDSKAGLSWHKAISQALRTSPESRPADASALLIMQGRSKMLIRTAICSFVVAVAICVALFLWPTTHTYSREYINPKASSENPILKDSVKSETPHLAENIDNNLSKDENSPKQINKSILDESLNSIDSQPTIDSELKKCERKRDKAVENVKSYLPILLDSMHFYARDTSLPPRKRMDNFSKIFKMYYRITDPLMELRNTFPEAVLSKHSVEWCTYGDPDLRDFNKKFQTSAQKYLDELQQEINAEKAQWAKERENKKLSGK